MGRADNSPPEHLQHLNLLTAFALYCSIKTYQKEVAGVPHAFSPSAWEAEAGVFCEFDWGQPSPHEPASGQHNRETLSQKD